MSSTIREDVAVEQDEGTGDAQFQRDGVVVQAAPKECPSGVFGENVSSETPSSKRRHGQIVGVSVGVRPVEEVADPVAGCCALRQPQVDVGLSCCPRFRVAGSEPRDELCCDCDAGAHVLRGAGGVESAVGSMSCTAQHRPCGVGAQQCCGVGRLVGEEVPQPRIDCVGQLATRTQCAGVDQDVPQQPHVVVLRHRVQVCVCDVAMVGGEIAQQIRPLRVLTAMLDLGGCVQRKHQRPQSDQLWMNSPVWAGEDCVELSCSGAGVARVVDEQIEPVARSAVPQTVVSAARPAHGVSVGIGADEWTAEPAPGAR